MCALFQWNIWSKCLCNGNIWSVSTFVIIFKFKWDHYRTISKIRNTEYIARLFATASYFDISDWEYNDFTRELWRLKSPATRILVQQLIPTTNKTHQNSTLLALDEWSVDCLHNGPVMPKAFSCHDVTIDLSHCHYFNCVSFFVLVLGHLSLSMCIWEFVN